ncbi:MAG: hypothetical protein J1G02_03495 [Clostridiales bacterium]|nr:hypothetical protein [Clostridiales bacterium]
MTAVIRRNITKKPIILKTNATASIARHCLKSQKVSRIERHDSGSQKQTKQVKK